MADTNITETNVDYEPSVDIQDVNDEIWFDIINRTITPKEGQDLKDVLVQNDANSRNFGFMIQRYFEDDDLSTKNIRVHYVNSLNQHDISAVHSINIVGTNSDVLSFMWLVGNKVCIETGNVQFAIEFYDDDGYELYTKPTMVKIEQGIYTVGEIPEPDDWYKLFKQELVDIKDKLNIDQTYSATSANAQSGIAVAEALGTIVGDLEEIPLGTVDKWEYKRFYKIANNKGVTPIYKYMFDDGTSQEMGELLPISIIVKSKQDILSSTHGSYESDIVYNFDGRNVREWTIDPKDKTIVLREFVPTTEINETATNTKYPTALAVKNFMNASIDKTYSSDSTNAQSGVAVAEAIAALKTEILGGLDEVLVSIGGAG